MSEERGTDIEALRAQIEGLTTEVRALSVTVAAMRGRDTPRPTQGRPTANYVQGSPFPREELWRATEQVAERAAALGVRGLAMYAGCYTGADAREYRWKLQRTADELLEQDDDLAARALAVLGNKQRLALLKAVLAQPGSAADLVERTGLTSPGQAYHHLNTLAAAGLIHSEERGQFAFVGHQAPAFLMLLTGVWDMLHSRYGTGTWAEDGQTTTA